MTNELKPCPFCGEAGKLQTREDGGGEILVICQSCESSAWVDKWNTRSREPVVTPCTDAVEALRTAISQDWYENAGDYTTSGIIKHLTAQGYTITRAVAPSGELAEAVHKLKSVIKLRLDADLGDYSYWQTIAAALSELEALRAKPKMSEADMVIRASELTDLFCRTGLEKALFSGIEELARKYAGEDV